MVHIFELTQLSTRVTSSRIDKQILDPAMDLPMPTPTVPNKSLTSFKSLSFDIYGTLIDWESSIVQQCKPLIEATTSADYKDASTDQSARERLTACFNDNEAELMTEHPGMIYSELLRRTYLKMANDLGVEVTSNIESEAQLFGNSCGSWLAFSDTIDAMQRLAKYYHLVPLSNVDVQSFTRTCEGPLKGVNFWRKYLAEDIGSYKPDLRNFEYLLKKLNEDEKSEGGGEISKEEDLMVAQSLFHDHAPCKKMGIASVWIARKGAGAGAGSGVKDLHDKGLVGYGWKFPTLGAFADEVEKAWADEGKKARY